MIDLRRCLITDRRRLTPDADSFESARRLLLGLVRRAVDAGVELIQVRERDLEAAALLDLVADIVAETRSSGTHVVVNERVDVAMAAAADGVHLRSDSVAADVVRAIVPAGFLIGRSIHGAEEARAAGPVDYLIAGTVFPTISKPEGHTLLGVDGLASVVRAARVPVLAVGGITSTRLDEVARAGAAGVAGIGLFLNRFDAQAGAR